MPKFRKKPVEIEAFRYEPTTNGSKYFNEMPQWLQDAYDHDDDIVSNVTSKEHPETRLKIETLEGTMYANEGDWIIRGVKGELYPCKPDIFAATYDPV